MALQGGDFRVLEPAGKEQAAVRLLAFRFEDGRRGAADDHELLIVILERLEGVDGEIEILVRLHRPDEQEEAVRLQAKPLDDGLIRLDGGVVIDGIVDDVDAGRGNPEHGGEFLSREFGDGADLGGACQHRAERSMQQAVAALEGLRMAEDRHVMDDDSLAAMQERTAAAKADEPAAA
ncbi:conserved hypothetical protein [Ricinus communis]|uniref:Uncharacterized protein n=1 Tax=Ricinus communis TaxID=3988 RepID=B9TMK2_RICCO|nr:conserved hypothetical protein [Ricinus communis]